MDWSHELPDSCHSGEAARCAPFEVYQTLRRATDLNSVYSATTARTFLDLPLRDAERHPIIEHGTPNSHRRQTEGMFDHNPNASTGMAPGPGPVVAQEVQDLNSLHDTSRVLSNVNQANEWEKTSSSLTWTSFSTSYGSHPLQSLPEHLLQQPLPEPPGAHMLLAGSRPAFDREATPNPALSLQQGYPMQLTDYHICSVEATADPKVFVFRCNDLYCYGRTYTRWPDFQRHYNGAHALEKTVFWCPVSTCNRSEGDNNRPFPRKDRMMDHAAKVHSMERMMECRM